MRPTVGVLSICGSCRAERILSHLQSLDEAEEVLVLDWNSDEGLPVAASLWNAHAPRVRQDILVFTNQDLHYDPGFLPEVRQLCWSGVRLCGWWQEVSEEDYHAGKLEVRDPGEVDNWSLVIWRDDFLRLGGFDDRLEFFGADVNMNERLKAAGFHKETLSRPFWHLSHDRDLSLLPQRNEALERAREWVSPGGETTHGLTRPDAMCYER